MNDKTLGACQCHEKHAPEYWKAVVREYTDALENAEQERDEARASAYNWQATAEEWEKRALATQPRPLTPDAITDEMVERAKAELEARAGGDYYPETIEAVLTAALTEPPKRPEGAEDIEDLLADWFGENDDPDQSNRDLADYLVRKGVRVVDEEDPR